MPPGLEARMAILEHSLAAFLDSTYGLMPGGSGSSVPTSGSSSLRSSSEDVQPLLKKHALRAKPQHSSYPMRLWVLLLSASLCPSDLIDASIRASGQGPSSPQGALQRSGRLRMSRLITGCIGMFRWIPPCRKSGVGPHPRTLCSLTLSGRCLKALSFVTELKDEPHARIWRFSTTTPLHGKLTVPVRKGPGFEKPQLPHNSM